ncbi:hypothetical protein SISSUDRAFT_1126274 [Sistotremastrum suecicum HHB10207 ss-3]|uniref:Uncharacterized protein n=1 Tax=Sistotremastrum suecicum HHB10207 ss-3 TaxID=1314776 RepID=A0A166GIG8_9AGAM|nr:hypothetical protein SISSUDRAFT_1126274 [Sistotremastrum suecicum HHB10207 ss-3]
MPGGASPGAFGPWFGALTYMARLPPHALTTVLGYANVEPDRLSCLTEEEQHRIVFAVDFMRTEREYSGTNGLTSRRRQLRNQRDRLHTQSSATMTNGLQITLAYLNARPSRVRSPASPQAFSNTTSPSQPSTSGLAANSMPSSPTPSRNHPTRIGSTGSPGAPNELFSDAFFSAVENSVDKAYWMNRADGQESSHDIESDLDPEEFDEDLRG